MKLLLAFVFISCSFFCKAQTCICDSLPELSERVDCKTVLFSNKAKVYWQFNCDSSWLTFENNSRKEILFSMEMIDYTERLGYSYATEYDKYFLIENRLISGCCEPAEYILFDKELGKLKENVGFIVFYSEDKNYPFIINLDSTANNLVIVNVESGSTRLFPLEKDRVINTLKATNEMYPEFLFEKGVIDNGILNIEFNYQDSEKSPPSTQKISIDFKKFKN